MTDEPIVDRFEQDLSELSQKEIKAYKSFEASYRVIYPPPVEPSNIQSFKKDWKFLTSVITAVAGTALAAFRTGGAFYAAAVYDLDPVLSLAEAVVAVLAIEGCLVLFSVRKAHDEQTANDSAVYGLIVAFTISVLAGLYQSANILSGSGSDAFTTIVNWVLVVFMGIGATVIAWLSGHSLGVQLVRFENEHKEEKVHYIKSLAAYRANMLKNWRTSYELDAVNERKSSRYRTASTNERYERVQANSSPERSRTNTGASRDEINLILDMVLQQEARVAGVSEVARKMAMNRSTANNDNPPSDADFHRYKGIASESRRRWMLDKGIIDEQGNVAEKGA